MISLLKSIWATTNINQQLLIFIGLNFVFLALIMMLVKFNLIPEPVIIISNIVFWFITGFIVVFGKRARQ